MSFKDKLIKGVDATLNGVAATVQVSLPIVKKTGRIIEFAAYQMAKHNMENNLNFESVERSARIVGKLEDKYGKNLINWTLKLDSEKAGLNKPNIDDAK